MSNQKILLLVNNFTQGLNRALEFDRILFAPKFYSSIQNFFFESLFDSYKSKFKIDWANEIDSLENCIFAAWDTPYELKAFGNKIEISQNRLFDEIEFDFTDSFSNFRKKAEKALPEYYENAIAPQSDIVIEEINYYFKEKKLASTYFDTRNGLVGRDFSTKFSPYLSCGALDVCYLYNCVKDFENKYIKNKSTGWIIFELLWREFFYWHYQKHKEKYFSVNGLNGPKVFPEFKDYNFDELRRIKAPRFFKAALNELEETGFQSNRVRQIFASIWLNDLELNWLSGAFLFERTLIDYDVYSNYGNWMYLAGVGVDPRGKRYFNVKKQLDMYDPDRLYEKKWL